MKNTLFFTYSNEEISNPKNQKNVPPHPSNSIENATHCSQSSREKKKYLAQRKTNSSFECTFAFVLRCVRNQHSLLQMRLLLKNKINIFI